MYFDTLWIFVFGKPHFHSIYYNSQTNCCIILLFFSGEADSLCEHFEPSHTVFIDSQFMLWCHQTSSFPPRWNRATGVEMTNPKTLVNKCISISMLFLYIAIASTGAGITKWWTRAGMTKWRTGAGMTKWRTGAGMTKCYFNLNETS